MTKMIKWQSYKDHIDDILKKSREISGEIFELSKSELDEIETEEYEEVIDKFDVGHIPFLLPKKISRDLAISIFHECWVGYTNFNITEDVSKDINECDGVELLRISGRYTFIVGVGKCFDFSDVRKEINKKLKVGITKKGKNEQNNN
jgi:hypothetical protein